MHIPTFSIVIFLFISSIATAQIEDDLISLYDEDELITIATGTAKEVRFAPSVATVITENDIKNSGARFLDDVLEMVPGMHVGKGSNRQNAIYSLRGIHTDENPQVLLLIDGIDTAQLFNSSRIYNYRLPVANISRVEVIRGPGSAVYGADAFAGVINVITKKPSETDTKIIGGRFGSFGSDDLWFLGGAKFENFNIDLALEYSNSDGDDGRIVNSDAFGGRGPLSSHYEFFNTRLSISNEERRLTLSSYNLVSAGLGSGGAEVLDPDGRDKANAFKAHYLQNFNDLVQDWRFNVSLSGGIVDQKPKFIIYPKGTTINSPPFPSTLAGTYAEGVLGEPSTKDSTYKIEISSIFDGFANHSVRISVGYEHQKIEAAETKNFHYNQLLNDAGNPIFTENDGITNIFRAGNMVPVTGTEAVFLPNKKRTISFFSLQDEWQIANDWSLTAGLRYDDYNDFGSSLNPRLALVWAADYNKTVKFLYGRAFRAPSFAELEVDNNPALFGNPDLDPEIIDTYEIAFQYVGSENLKTNFNIFYYEIEDLIDYELNLARGGLEAENLFNQYGHGLEWELDWKINSNWSTKTNFSWQQSKQAGWTVADAPKQQIYSLLMYNDPNSDWNFSLVGTKVLGRDRSGVERSSVNGRNKVDDYSTINLILITINC